MALLDVRAIIDPETGEPLLEPATVRLLDEARARARAGDVKWLRAKGARVYTAARIEEERDPPSTRRSRTKHP
jgi:hypothetical protein